MNYVVDRVQLQRLELRHMNEAQNPYCRVYQSEYARESDRQLFAPNARVQAKNSAGDMENIVSRHEVHHSGKIFHEQTGDP